MPEKTKTRQYYIVSNDLPRPYIPRAIELLADQGWYVEHVVGAGHTKLRQKRGLLAKTIVVSQAFIIASKTGPVDKRPDDPKISIN